VSAPRPAPVVVRCERLPHGEGLPLPAYATPGSAGADLRAAVESDLWLAPGERRAVPTGFRLAVPEGFEAQVRPRSGLALGSGVTVANAPGTLDSDYRGELLVLLVNLSPAPVVLRRGDRIAQLVVAPVVRAEFELAPALEATSRGDGGFGSTGRD